MKTNGLYLVAHYPDRDTFNRAALEGLEHFDFLEVGIPFTDPVADGPVIADAAHRVLADGFTVAGGLETLREIRAAAPPRKKLYLMTYANIVAGRDPDRFARAAAKAGADGMIIPDAPFAESGLFRGALEKYGMEYISFITPETTPAQIKLIARRARGFLYFISIRGITGSALRLDRDTREKIALARKHSPVPVVLGFGVRDRRSIDTALKNADGFIMGTRFVEALRDGGLEGFRAVLKEMF
ncbi:MAG TPA: tryptophan synthase subunit alpha [Spirochaetes bacterium]|nr:tryptophan synthase subunit alpha [Spirochaetota bacterium]